MTTTDADVSAENFTTGLLHEFIAASHDIGATKSLVDKIMPVMSVRYCDLIGLPDHMHYAEATAHHRELAGIASVLELAIERAMQRVRNTLLESTTGKAPTVALMESTAATDQTVQAWRILQIRVTVLRDQFSGLSKAMEMAINNQTR